MTDRPNDLKPIGYVVFEADSNRIVRLDINHYIAEEVRDRLPGRRIALVYVKSEDLIEETQT